MPDNGFYYHAAYVVAAVVYSGYALSLVIRRRRLIRAYDALRDTNGP